MTKMKRCILFGLIIALLLSGCSPSASQGGTTASTDSALNTSAAEDASASSESGGISSEAYDRFRAGTYMTFAETDDYYFWLPMSCPKVHYFEKDSGAAGVLCFKPACRHNDLSCDAFVGIDFEWGSLTVRGGMLYWIGTDVNAVNPGKDGYGVWRMRIDGTEREFFGPIEYDERVKYSFQRAYLWGDFYYFVGNAQLYQPGKSGEEPEISYRVTLTRVPVSGGAVELLGEFTDIENPSPPMLLLDTDAVYLFTSGMEENNNESYTYSLTLLKYQIAENRTEILLKNQAMKDGTTEVRLHPAKGIIATPGGLKASGEHNPGDPLLYSLTDGQLVPWLDFSESIYEWIYVLEEGLLLMQFGTEEYEYELRDMEDNVVSSGILPLSFLNQESGKKVIFDAVWGGSREFFTEIQNHDTRICYIVRYRVTPDGLEESVLMQAEDDRFQ